jgi:hypothetical protein
MTGGGKGWARGKTAASDARIARAAAAHTGLTYQRRTPTELLRWRGMSGRPSSYDWTPTMAYAVGLIATDGCLIERGHAIAFVSQDAQLVEVLLRCLGREPNYRVCRTRLGREIYRFQIKDVVLYRWLEHAGLSPRKSLTLGPLHVPDGLMAHLVRGLLDGDGSIHFFSGSRAHVEWLHSELRAALGLRGWIGTLVRPDRHPSHRLAYGKHDSITLLEWLYADPNAPSLLRKREIWNDYVRRSSAPSK